jgi:predicted glycoside hydrolase/deacetylase ChbG (UPF0249 family)
MPFNRSTRRDAAVLQEHVPVVIVNCDDLGMHPCIDRAVVELLEGGRVRSTSLLAVGSSFDHAVSCLRDMGWMHAGVHLSLTSEYPALPMRPLTAEGRRLAPATGVFCPRIEDLPAAFDPSDVEAELRAQIARVGDARLTVSHLDGHMLFYEPQVAGHSGFETIVAGLARELGLPYRRHPGDGRRGVRTHMIWDEYETEPERFRYYERVFATAEPGLHEVIVHPALPDPRALASFTSVGHRRVADYLFFRSLDERVDASAVSIRGWQDVAVGGDDAPIRAR